MIVRMMAFEIITAWSNNLQPRMSTHLAIKSARHYNFGPIAPEPSEIRGLHHSSHHSGIFQNNPLDALRTPVSELE